MADTLVVAKKSPLSSILARHFCTSFAWSSSVFSPDDRDYQYSLLGTCKSCGNQDVLPKSISSGSIGSATDDDSPAFTAKLCQNVLPKIHLIFSLGIMLAMDLLLKQAFEAAEIEFPSALFGMFCMFLVLIILDLLIPAIAVGLMSFFEPAVLFIHRWLPLFYVPSLVVLPIVVKDIPAASEFKILGILVGGWLASLCVAAFTALAVRNCVRTEMIPAEPMPKPTPFSALEIWLPSGFKIVLHPIICCALSADFAAFAYGYISKSGFDEILGCYLTNASRDPGAGDVLMGFLGSVIISFAFSMFKQRKLMKRHAAEIFTSIIVGTIFSLYSTALAGRLVGLDRSLTVSILPRCITVALALSIVSFFEGANTSVTAAVVVLTGLVGANFVQFVLDKLRVRDPIARGIATASSAHGLGTAALSAREPEALPFCAIAYALTGIVGSLICSVPAVRQSLLAVIG
ncbi:hypothetical protein Cgig2_029426 [Carnegiea gigantea]|uniref:Plastidal glycolate/glycerate translocator 1, chloroplastic n=1 Tax=Carnegiea gigantea TaxID=171969 RepID=A0A9Q1GS91_9CARY|nr:hypothetical protein Cgig2_029426 [Carnegiea gigantea]